MVKEFLTLDHCNLCKTWYETTKTRNQVDKSILYNKYVLIWQLNAFENVCGNINMYGLLEPAEIKIGKNNLANKLTNTKNWAIILLGDLDNMFFYLKMHKKA